MGTIVYSNLLNLILSEGDFTIDEVAEEAKNRFGFNPNLTRSELSIIATIYKNCLEVLPNGKYHRKESLCSPDQLLKFLDEATPEYFNERPWMKKFYDELKNRNY